MGNVLRAVQASDRDALVELWRVCELTRPWNDPYRDIERKVAHDPSNLLVLESDGELIGSVMIGYEGHRGWVNYLAVHPAHRHRGHGRALMEEAEQHLRALGCPKINVQVRTSNTAAAAFYERIGFSLDEALSMGKRLETDAPNSVQEA